MVKIHLYLDKAPQSVRVRWGIWVHSTLLLFITLWPLGALGPLQLYCYLLYFGHLGHLGAFNFTTIYYTLATWGAMQVPKWSKEVPKGSKLLPFHVL